MEKTIFKNIYNKININNNYKKEPVFNLFKENITKSEFFLDSFKEAEKIMDSKGYHICLKKMSGIDNTVFNNDFIKTFQKIIKNKY